MVKLWSAGLVSFLCATLTTIDVCAAPPSTNVSASEYLERKSAVLSDADVGLPEAKQTNVYGDPVIKAAGATESGAETTAGPSTTFALQTAIAEFGPTVSGTGFYITADGFLISNEHVVKGASDIRLVTNGKLIAAKVVKLDSSDDLVLLKAEGKYSPVAVISSRSLRLGHTVATVGFPNIVLQGIAPKLAKGEIAGLSGVKDDPRYFQVSLPLQPGNSGGALIDERGNVVGIVSAKLDAQTAVATTGEIPENVNYAVKSSFLLSFLESAPEIISKLKEPNTNSMKFEEAVDQAQQAAVLVLCRAPVQVSPVPPRVSLPNLDQTVPVASDVSSDHSIDKVLDDGNFIRLEDGSVWQVEAADSVSASTWLESSEITTIKVDDSEYPYKIINTDDNESVRARRLRN